MKQNEYKNAVAKLKATEQSKADAKALFDSVNSETKDNVIVLKPKSKKKRAFAAVAACLALAIAFGAFVSVNNIPLTKDGGGFIMTVNAEAIPENGEELIISEDNLSMSLSNSGYSVSFPVICQGNNITSVTYSAENAVLINSSENLQNTEYYTYVTDAPGADIEYSPEKGNNANTNAYISYTVAYDEQTNPQEECPSVAGDLSFLKNGQERTEIETALNNLFENSFEGDRAEYKKSIMDKFLNDVKLTVTVNYTDGTFESKNLKVGCKTAPYTDGIKSGNALYITYSIVNE